MIKNIQTPYSNLNPDLILNAVDAAGFQCSGSLLALNSFENRVYQIGIENAPPIIAKFYRPQRWSDEAILEEHQFAMELCHLEIPVIAPLINSQQKTLHHFEGYRFALFPRQGGRALELDNIEHLEWMGRFIGRLHALSVCKSFSHRITLTIENYGMQSSQFLIQNHFIPDHLIKSFSQVVDAAINKVKECYEKAGRIQFIRLHGDCHAGNVLWNDEGPKIVDLDDCLMGPAVQDLWMLLSGDEYQMKSQLTAILEGYQEFHDFNFSEIHLIEGLRTLRMLHYAAWLAKRWNDPAFPHNFPWFNTESYWQQLIQHLNQQAL